MQFLLSSRLYCRFWNFTKSATLVGRGLYRRWGIAPRPEELVIYRGYYNTVGREMQDEKLSDETNTNSRHKIEDTVE